MKLVYHGGKCCGVKNIHGLGYDPAYTVESVQAVKATVTCDGGSGDMGSQTQMTCPALPAQSAGARFLALLAVHDKLRKNGIIEVTTTDMCDQTPKWRPILEEAGFKDCGDCLNSNSGHRVTFWLRFTDATAKAQSRLSTIIDDDDD